MKQNNYKEPLLISIFIGIPIILWVLNIALGISTETYFDAPYYSNYRLTLFEALFDFEKFLGDFIGNIVFAGIIAGYFLIYHAHIPRKIPLEHQSKQKRLSIILLLVATILFFVGLVGSIFNWGFVRPYLDDQETHLIFWNFYPNRAAEQILLWALLLSGISIIFHILGLKVLQIPIESKRIGFFFILGCLIIINIVLIVSPLDWIFMFDGNAVIDLLYSIIQIIFINGLMFLYLFLNKKGNDFIPSGMAGSSVKLVKNLWRNHLIAVFSVFIVGLIGILYYSPFTQIGIVRFLQHVLSFIFRILLVFGFYFLGNTLQSKREV